ncbi:winged helix-turn-helix domain-containing protein [Stenotrophomonas sp. HMWF022]|uniref:MarR family winged helix-turn-helix transcriptional regulator n=1 Tax=Stenotrophomonas sp. HMWF023 TaxID=2056859 RepID=UPI000D3B4188|nr:MarR family winged helix-turn-helix transcriptional regulator [Stenotrophomonas sp. HMWF023]PTS71915.1 winged helix-turn-helix domain-containing protein [Stenotrophomonas sp. HMWF023]PTT45655.1 winged helix-turn-helix domain-containing protein [Stenotrophomonas sp. HMWF022]
MNHPARSSDPSTSHEAARHVVNSGLQADQQAVALAAVRKSPGLTSNELAQCSTLDRYMLARRLPELQEAELVWRGPKKPCEVSGRSACTWWPVAPGENLMLAV